MSIYYSILSGPSASCRWLAFCPSGTALNRGEPPLDGLRSRHCSGLRSPARTTPATCSSHFHPRRRTAGKTPRPEPGDRVGVCEQSGSGRSSFGVSERPALSASLCARRDGRSPRDCSFRFQLGFRWPGSSLLSCLDIRSARRAILSVGRLPIFVSARVVVCLRTDSLPFTVGLPPGPRWPITNQVVKEQEWRLMSTCVHCPISVSRVKRIRARCFSFSSAFRKRPGTVIRGLLAWGPSHRHGRRPAWPVRCS